MSATLDTLLRLNKAEKLPSTPWGQADYAKELAPGIVFYGTPSHGGIHLERYRQAAMPAGLKRDTPWYEEDCDYNRVLLAFPEHFTTEEVAEADKAMKAWFPDDYQEWSGKVVTAAESHTVREREFYAAHANDYLVVSAWGSWHKDVADGWVGVFAVIGGRHKNGHYPPGGKYFLVPAAEYDNRDISFVVDPARHPEVHQF